MNTVFLFRLDSVESIARRDAHFLVHIEILHADLACQLALRFDFVVDLQVFEEVLRNTDDPLRVFLIHNGFYTRLFEHLVAIAAICHEDRHCHSVVSIQIQEARISCDVVELEPAADLSFWTEHEIDV